MSKEIKPVELCIEADEVVKRYPVTEAIEVVRCRTSIFLHSTGLFVVSKPTLANNLQGGALFETLRWYCDYMDSRDEYTDEDKERHDTFAAMIVNILTLPMDIFTDVDFMLDIADYLVKKRNEYYERLQDEASRPREETIDDALENAAFEGEVLASERVVKELGKMAKKKGNGTDGITS